MKPIGLPIYLSENTPPNEDVGAVAGGLTESGEDDSYRKSLCQVSSSRLVFAGSQRTCDLGSPGRRKISPAHLPFTRSRGLATAARRGVEHGSTPFDPFGESIATFCRTIVKTCPIAPHW